MKTVVSLVSAVVILALSACLHADNVGLRSCRRATADVEQTRDAKSFRVKVSFLAVSTLTEVANERVSRLMAQGYAEQALRLFLKADKCIAFSQARIASCQFTQVDDGRICTAIYEIPKSAVSDIEVKRENAESSRLEWRRFVKACEQDGKNAIEDFRSACYKDLRLAEAAFLYEIEGRKISPDALRKEIVSALSAICDKVRVDDMLMQSEQDELIGKVGTVRQYLLKKLDESGGEAVSGKIQENAKLISKGEFRTDTYRTLLLSDAVLLETGGCRMFDVDGKLYVIAVGATEVRNDTERDRIRRKEVAQEKARVEVVNGRQTDVMHFRRFSSSAEVKHANGVETSSDVEMLEDFATSKAADHVDDMEIVGTWYSPDGKMYFLALGCEIDDKKGSMKRDESHE